MSNTSSQKKARAARSATNNNNNAATVAAFRGVHGQAAKDLQDRLDVSARYVIIDGRVVSNAELAEMNDR